MDAQTVWVAVRALSLATGLLVHETAQQPSDNAERPVPVSAEMATQHWRYAPHGMSMDQAIVALGALSR